MSDTTLTFSDETDVIVINPAPPAPQPCAYGNSLRVVTCSALGIDGLIIDTGDVNDKVTVTAPMDASICGRGGNDILIGGDRIDYIYGGPGDDQIQGGGADDLLYGEQAGCVESGPAPAGVDTLEGGDGGDLLTGGAGRDTLRGGAGEDQLYGLTGDDELDGGPDGDLLAGLDGQDILRGGTGDDAVTGGAGDDALFGDEGNDRLGLPIIVSLDRGPVQTSLDDGDDLVEAGAGDDMLVGGPGPSTLVIGVPDAVPVRERSEPNGADTLRGGPGVDLVTYENRSASIEASLDGQANDGAPGEGDDIASDVEQLAGGSRADRLTGGLTDDVLDGGLGADTLFGADGADTVVGGSVDDAADTIDGGAGPDTLSGGPGADAITGGPGADMVRGGEGADRLAGAADDDTLDGESGDDDLDGGGGADIMIGGLGNDGVDYGGALRGVSVTLDQVRNDGEAGEDWVRDIERIRGSAWDDTLLGDTAANQLDGRAGDDLLDPGGGRDTVSAGPGRDAVRTREGEEDRVACGPGADFAIVDPDDELSPGTERCERADAGGRPPRGEATLSPAACRLDVRLPGLRRSVPVAERIAIPRRTRVDARVCAANLTPAARRGRVRANRGEFVVRKTGVERERLELELAGGTFGGCRATPAPPIRRLVLRGGPVRVRGRFGSTLGRRATWTIEDRCASTRVGVQRGSVRVTDIRTRRTRLVRAGQSHVSRARRR